MPVQEILYDVDMLIGGAASPFTPFDLFTALGIADDAFLAGFLGPSDAMHLTLPPSITPAVTEPSTWAMLLVGFAGLGIVRYRASRRRKAVAGSSGLPQSRG